MAYVRTSMCPIWKWMAKSSFLFPSSLLQLDGGLDLLSGNPNNTAVMSSISQVYFISSSFGEQGLTSICKYDPHGVYCHCDFIQHMCSINGPGTIRIQLHITRCQRTCMSSNASCSRGKQSHRSGFVSLLLRIPWWRKLRLSPKEDIWEKKVGNTFDETHIYRTLKLLSKSIMCPCEGFFFFYKLPHKAVIMCYK